jgi:hypothetical protein
VTLGARAAQSSSWAWVQPRADFRYNGLAPSCSTAPQLDVDPTGATLFPADYRFLVRPGSPDKLVVYFDGGGGCWDFESCIHQQSFSQALDTTEIPELGTSSGIFDFANPLNPVRDWTFVIVTYCTGDVHTGTRDANYGGYTIRHRGRVNAESVYDWMFANYPSVERLLVTGSSAGGYGAHFNFMRVANFYLKANPDVQVAHVGDGSTLSAPPPFVAHLRDVWGAVDLGGDIRDYAALAPLYPSVHFGVYAAERDETLVAFRDLQCQTVPDLVGGCTGCSVCEFQDDVTATLAIASAAPNFRYYISAGTVHTILQDVLYYTENSPGVAFHRWFSALINTPGEAPIPASAACSECLQPCPRGDLCGPVSPPPPGQ